jgi:hypothetical protein
MQHNINLLGETVQSRQMEDFRLLKTSSWSFQLNKTRVFHVYHSTSTKYVFLLNLINIKTKQLIFFGISETLRLAFKIIKTESQFLFRSSRFLQIESDIKIFLSSFVRFTFMFDRKMMPTRLIAKKTIQFFLQTSLLNNLFR